MIAYFSMEIGVDPHGSKDMLTASRVGYRSKAYRPLDRPVDGFADAGVELDVLPRHGATKSMYGGSPATHKRPTVNQRHLR